MCRATAAQLATARQLQERFGLRFPLIHANAEQALLAAGRARQWPGEEVWKARKTS